ncbi:thiamine transporter TPC1 KNAG_0B01090 [Huiozyma naganishii CBS 8797]|uniref:Mitochondrial thiamine pyrophosphate carrier 1 n=1 Tax=Huiozyma naganishii (strain ATCC MYA-139 / BCRC 22969 / CBS 8797 / KCTC 17520 / NBRC 10181 / NCYC 3082 / Yp74L-3) TaxID=1071383 RepID=J7S4G7_HUIN7|nr:hypothetical protein KNAG_0B01090 [Kazachstania naganishii CBS 8797]CCK68556.1 hypothetical protein KNAG_0B01090 [Kazachstania naganishii CBS 8797]
MGEKVHETHDFLRKGENVNVTASLLAGSISGLVARVVTTPLDTLKIRFQITPWGDSKTIVRTISDVMEREGLRAFWKGNVPGMMLYVLYGGIQFSSYSWYSNMLKDYTINGQIHSVTVGALAGMTSSLVSYPFDVLRTRFVANQTAVLFNTKDAIRDIWVHEGIHGFFRGSVMSMATITMATATMFGTYESIKIFCDEQDNGNRRLVNILNHSASSISGVVSKVVTFPIDTIRRRVQLQNSIHIDKFSPQVPAGNGTKSSLLDPYRGKSTMLSLGAHIWKTEGPEWHSTVDWVSLYASPFQHSTQPVGLRICAVLCSCISHTIAPR